MGGQARGTGGVDSASSGGKWDISNADRIGKGEVNLVNILIEGAAQLVKWEDVLQAGGTLDDKAIDAGIAAVKGQLAKLDSAGPKKSSGPSTNNVPVSQFTLHWRW